MSTGVTAVVQVLDLLDLESDDLRFHAGPIQVENPEHFGVAAEIYIGEAGNDSAGTDKFHLMVCSPSWFAQEWVPRHWSEFGHRPMVMSEAVLPGAGVWFMRRWNQQAFAEAVDAVCDAYRGAPEFFLAASGIGRWIPWEWAADYDDRFYPDNDADPRWAWNRQPIVDRQARSRDDEPE